ncbi:unnamed protein product [Lampetra planeri]
MAEVYEPPSDAHRKFVQCQRAPEESPVAYHGALIALAMAAYPDTKPYLLEPLMLGKMLELSKDLAIPMPVCGHEPLTSRLVAKCLDTQFNLRRWAQMAAWTGDLAVDGNPTGWALSRVILTPDDAGPA